MSENEVMLNVIDDDEDDRSSWGSWSYSCTGS